MGFMKPKMPAPPPPPPEPPQEDPAAKAAAEQSANIELQRKRRGLASTILTSPAGVTGGSGTAANTLLGQG